MSDAPYNPFLQRNTSPPNDGSDGVPAGCRRTCARAFTKKLSTTKTQSRKSKSSPIARFLSDALDGNDRFSKWFWSFAVAAIVSGILTLTVTKLLVAPDIDTGIALLIAGVIGAVYGVVHATWRMGKICRAIEIDHDSIRLTYGKRDQLIDPLQVDAVYCAERNRSQWRRAWIFQFAKPCAPIGGEGGDIFEPILRPRIFRGPARSLPTFAAIPAEGNSLPPAELAEHHADRAGIDSLRRLRKYYGQYVMQLAFSSLRSIVLMLAGGSVPVAFTLGPKGLQKRTRRRRKIDLSCVRAIDCRGVRACDECRGNSAFCERFAKRKNRSPSRWASISRGQRRWRRPALERGHRPTRAGMASPQPAIAALAWSPDGQVLHGACFDRTGEPGLMVDWDAGTGKSVAQFTDAIRESSVVYADALVADGRGWLHAVTDEETIRLTDWPAGKVRHALPSYRSRVMAVSFTPDAKAFVARSMTTASFASPIP